MKKAIDLGKEPVLPLVLKLAVPTMIAQFVTVLYNIVDRMYIGNIPQNGDLALAGAGICGPVITLLTSFGTLVGIGGSILMSMRLGAGKRDEAKKLLANSFLMLLLFSAVLTLVFLAAKGPLLMCFGASEITFPYADTYITIYTFGTCFSLVSIGLNCFITCQGFARAGMVTVLIGAVSNIILDPLFIFVFDLGIAGAAVATVLSQLFSCLFALYMLLYSRQVPVKITFRGYSFSRMRQILKLGISPFLILATDSIILIAMNTALQHYGGKSQGDLLITSAAIVQSYMLLITSPLLGITSGTQSILSYNYGAGKPKRILEAEKFIVLICLGFTSIMFVLSRVLPQLFAGIFTDSPQQISLAVWGIRTFTLGVIPLSFEYALVDGLTALGRTRISLALSLARKLIFLGFIAGLPLWFSAKSIFYAEPAADVLAALLSTTTFLCVIKKCLPLATA